MASLRHTHAGRVGPGRFAARLPALAAALAAAALLGLLLPHTLAAQSPTPNIAELRKVIAVRDAERAQKPEQVVAAAHAYLVDFPDGQYADEVLLALAQGYVQEQHPELALQAYNRLIKDFKDSPFREQALGESVPLLAAQGDQKAAFERVDALLGAYPNSLQRSRVLLWKADAQTQAGDSEGALATLKRIDPQQDLEQSQEADYYRLQTMALVRTGQSAWAPLQRYLQRDDTPDHKAEVLMLVGEVARKADRPDEALRFYRQVVEDYPVPAHLGEALYWRAKLFADTRLGDAPDEVRAARRETAIGYYAAYLESGDKAHRADALVGRGALQQQAGRLQPALADYEEAVKLDPKLGTDPATVRARVAILQGLGQSGQAVALLEAVRKDARINPAERTVFQVQEASLQYDAKQCEKVEALLDPMPIIADPQLRARAFFMRGFCRYQRQQWEKATFDLEGLINDPHYQDLALQPLLEAYEKSGQFSRLVNLTEELLQAGRVKPSADLLKRLAHGYDKLGEPGLMLSAYERLEKLDPAAVQAPEIQLQMGLAREKLDQRDAAVANYRSVLERPDAAKSVPVDVYLTALEHLQAIYIAEGKLKALGPLHKAAAKVATGPKAKARLAALQRDMDVALAGRALAAGNATQALPRLDAAFKATPVDQPAARARVTALLITAYARTGDGNKAAELYKAEAHGKEGKDGKKAEAYRTQLATALIATVEAQPDALRPLKAPAAGKDGAKPAGKGKSKGKPKPAAKPKDGSRALMAVYREALSDLPPDQSQQRYQAAQLLDKVYQERGDHAARASLVTLLLKDGLDEKTKQDLRIYQGQIYKDWGQALLDKGDLEAAQFQLERGLKEPADADWRQRYELTALLSRVELKRKEYSKLVLMNEAILPKIEDQGLAAQVRHFLGQVYVQWGKEAETEDNAKSARIRYRYALDYLPASDWQRRLAATNGLAKVQQAQGHPADAAAAYEKVLPQIQDAGVKQRYELYLGRLYADKVKDPEKASQWFKQADTGGKDAISLEAGYLWADQQLAADHGDAALTRLKELASRGIAGTKWVVPIHYRIAVLLHQRKELKEALAHYRIVADAKGAEVRKLYPRTIDQAREQVRRIQAYLKAGGGQGGVAVPTVRPD
ncbi:MAG TPA: tetratricopeptide repeat protein [bacterium]|nr:tetratricopeptide repeat protein [bacterium]